MTRIGDWHDAVRPALRDRRAGRAARRRSSSIRPHCGRVYPAALPGACPPRRAGAPPLRGRFCRRALRRRRAARRADDGGAISRAPISTSTASPTSSTRACSRAGCRPSPTPARCGSPAGSARSPASSAMRRRSTPGACRSTRRCGGSRALQALSRRAATGCSSDACAGSASAVLIDCHSMPSASSARDDGRAGRLRARRPLRHELRAGDLADVVEATLRGRGYAVARNKPYAGGFITEHYGDPGRRTCTPSRSRSTARSTWTSGAMSARRPLGGSPPT